MPSRSRSTETDEITEKAKSLFEAIRKSTLSKLALILASIFAAFWTYFQFGPETQANSARLDDQDERISGVEQVVEDVQLDVAGLQTDVAAIEAAVAAIQVGVDAAVIQLEKARKLIGDLQGIRDELVNAIEGAD